MCGRLRHVVTRWLGRTDERAQERAHEDDRTAPMLSQTHAQLIYNVTRGIQGDVQLALPAIRITAVALTKHDVSDAVCLLRDLLQRFRQGLVLEQVSRPVPHAVAWRGRGGRRRWPAANHRNLVALGLEVADDRLANAARAAHHQRVWLAHPVASARAARAASSSAK